MKTDEDPRYYTTTKDLDSVFDHVEATVRAGKTKDTPLIGETEGGGRISFRDMPPIGAVLVSFEALCTQASVTAIRPLYRDRYNVFPGKEYGQEISDEIRGKLQTDRRVAPYGYAVGRVGFRAHLGQSLLGWSYQPLVQNQRPASSDDSELDNRVGRAGFIGLRTKLQFIEIPEGAIVVGVYGKYPKDRSSGFSGDFALGLITIPAATK